MNQHLTVQQLSSALDGALVGPSLEVVVRHLAVCVDCRDRQSRLVRHDDVLRRLLSPEAGEAFLEALGARAEDVAVAIARGTPPPPLVTSVPLLHEEDPYASGEPPVDPGLGSDRFVAQEGGYGRIGMKPTGSTQPPEADAAEARRWLDALENGPADARAFTESPQGPEPEATAFGLPQWIEDRAGHGAPPSREPQPLRLVPAPEPLPPPFYDESLERHAEGDPYAPPASMPLPADPYTPRTLMPISLDPYGQRISEPMPEPPPPPVYAQAPRERDASASASAPEPGYATRGTALAAARRRAIEEARVRGLKRHWLIAGASVCVLLLIVLALQLVPAAKMKPAPSTESPPAVGSGTQDLSSASSRAPVEEVVPPKPADVPVDTSVFAEDAPEDSTGVEPE